MIPPYPGLVEAAVVVGAEVAVVVRAAVVVGEGGVVDLEVVVCAAFEQADASRLRQTARIANHGTNFLGTAPGSQQRQTRLGCNI
jgi:hypothetical protein